MNYFSFELLFVWTIVYLNYCLFELCSFELLTWLHMYPVVQIKTLLHACSFELFLFFFWGGGNFRFGESLNLFFRGKFCFGVLFSGWANLCMGNLKYLFWGQIFLFKGIFKVYEGFFLSSSFWSNYLKVGCIYKTFGDKNKLNLSANYKYLVAWKRADLTH